MKKIATVLLSFTLLVTSLCGCNQGTASSTTSNTTSSAASSSSDKPVIIRLGYLPEVDTFEDEVAKAFKAFVEEESGGSITVNLFPGGQLGGETEMTEQCKMGTTEMIMVGEISAIDIVPEYATAMRVPYLFDSYEHLVRFLEEPMSDTGKTVPEMVNEKAGLNTIGYYNRGSRQLTSNRAVHSVGNLNGLKLRVPTIAISVSSWKLTGAVPTAVEAGELYMALQQGLVEAQENPLDFISGKSLNEVQKYLIMTNHQHGMRWLIVNDKFSQSLSESQQDVLLRAGKLYSETGNRLLAESESVVLDKLLSQGMELIEGDEVDIESIKQVILNEIGTLGADWKPATMEAVEKTR